MCVICVKPAGVDFPSEERLQQMFTSNSDGCGFMYTRNKKVNILKGFMKLKHMKRALRQYGVTKDDTVVFHFRIATAGSVSPGNCHPFPISDKISDLRSLSISTTLGIAHNGILDYDADKSNDLSDTMTFVRDVLSVVDLSSPGVFALLEMSIGTNKMAILDCDGKVHLLGNWSTDKTDNPDLLYSNLFFKAKSQKVTTYYSYGKDYSTQQKTIYDRYFEKYGKYPPAWHRSEMSKKFSDEHESMLVIVKEGDTKCACCGYPINFSLTNPSLACSKCGKIYYFENANLLEHHGYYGG